MTRSPLPWLNLNNFITTFTPDTLDAGFIPHLQQPLRLSAPGVLLVLLVLLAPLALTALKPTM